MSCLLLKYFSITAASLLTSHCLLLATSEVQKCHLSAGHTVAPDKSVFYYWGRNWEQSWVGSKQPLPDSSQGSPVMMHVRMALLGKIHLFLQAYSWTLKVTLLRQFSRAAQLWIDHTHCAVTFSLYTSIFKLCLSCGIINFRRAEIICLVFTLYPLLSTAPGT